ncbi:hypothetical protein ACVQEN_06005 [Stenotrophomonas acidaminiphila]
MLIGYGMPAVQSVALVGGAWLTADAGAALFDGKPARRSRIARTGALSINITFAGTIVPRIVALLGLSLPPGVPVTAAGASGTTVRLPDGSVCAWLFPTGAASVSSVSVGIDTTAATVEVGEIAVLRAVDVGIADGWAVATIDTSVHTRTKGAQLNTVEGPRYRRFTGNLSARHTDVAHGAGLGGTDWDAVVLALQGRRRGCIVPEYSRTKGGSIDPALAARSAIYGAASNTWSVENVSGRYFAGYLEFEEVPA